MKMNLSGYILKLFGWKAQVSVPDYPKCIICVAPHTSNWDFIIGKLAYASVGRKSGFLMKETWFFWPLGAIFRAIGGVPVARGRKRKGSLVETLTERFRKSDRLVLAITPEGTRSPNPTWHTGFLQIAIGAGIPIALAVIDYADKRAEISRTFTPTGDVEADMRAIKEYYRGAKGRFPENFVID